MIDDKPNLKRRLWGGLMWWQCSDGKIESIGHSPEEAFEKWKRMKALRYYYFKFVG